MLYSSLIIVVWEIEIMFPHIAVKNYPLKFSGNISPTTENISIKFYMPIARSNIRKNAKFYSIISNFDIVMPY